MASKDVAVEAVANNREEFREDFGAWLCDNFTIYQKFEAHARVMARKRKTYSARTIVEFIRHHTAMREKDGEFKITNNVIPDMARLFAILNPDNAGLFEFRRSEMRVSTSEMARAA